MVDPRQKSKILPRGALIEFTQMGTHLKVIAMDPVSLLEVSIIGDPKAGQAQLQTLAVKKLETQLRKQLELSDTEQARASAVTRSRRPEPKSGWDL